jgi:vacuolar-type H+-ATPase subunit I/STV1
MRTWLIASAVVLLCACIASCGGKHPRETAYQRVASNDSLGKIIAQRDNEINDMMATLNDIQVCFREINEAEDKVNLAKNGEGVDKAQQIRENIKFISSRMDENRALIKKLQAQLRTSSFKGDEMKKIINNMLAQLNDKDKQLQQLRVELDAKDIHISELDETINNLNSNVSDLQTETEEKARTISSQDKLLNTAWFVFGTKKELREQRILVNGKVLQSSFNHNYFTKIDIRVTKEIKLYSKSVTLLTNHPAGSYTLQRDATQQYELRITNPQQFWSTSKYLVMIVK